MIQQLRMQTALNGRRETTRITCHQGKRLKSIARHTVQHMGIDLQIFRECARDLTPQTAEGCEVFVQAAFVI
jgi:hypothetical protein